MKNPYKKIKFIWVDAVSDAGWKDIEEVLKERPHVVKPRDTYYTPMMNSLLIALSMSFSKDKDKWEVNGWTCIPAKWIKR